MTGPRAGPRQCAELGGRHCGVTGERHHGWETQPAMSRQGVGTHQGSTSPSLPQGWTQESPGVPGLDSGMTLGKWRREGLRGLWRERRRGEATAGRSPGPQATAGAKGRSSSRSSSQRYLLQVPVCLPGPRKGPRLRPSPAWMREEARGDPRPSP